MQRLLLFAIASLPFGFTAARSAEPSPAKTIHVFVALADNKSQGIIPVPAKIGNGDDPENNLYWGCTEGMKVVFRTGADWKLIATPKPPKPEILERCIFQRKSPAAWIIADAYRGSDIKQCTADFFEAAGGNARGEQTTDAGPISTGGAADLIAYIGHDGLMDFATPTLTPPAVGGKPVIVLCCKSADFFGPPLHQVQAKPLLLTTQLMYPGSFILKAALEGWLHGESAESMRQRAAKAYATNQRISVKAAAGVFTAGQN